MSEFRVTVGLPLDKPPGDAMAEHLEELQRQSTMVRNVLSTIDPAEAQRFQDEIEEVSLDTVV